MTREEHLKAIWITGSAKRGRVTGVLLVCSGPECGGAEMFARPNAFDVGAESAAHIDKMDGLT